MEETSCSITVLSQNNFDNLMDTNDINDKNVESYEDTMFISIIGTKECLKYYLDEEDTKHHFQENHSNVLNLEFDDVSEDFKWRGHIFKAMSEAQAKELFDFIEDNIKNGRRNVFVHCRAGVSRSQAIAFFVASMYPKYYQDQSKLTTLCYDYANKGVLVALKRQYYEKYGI